MIPQTGVGEKPKENVLLSLIERWGLYNLERNIVDLIQQCALAFQTLLAYEYHFVIGRKGKVREFYLTFEKSDFHHLLGLHKLRDIPQIQRGMREKIFDKIIEGSVSMDLIGKSVYYEEMEERIIPLIGLEKMLDDNNMIFRYNEKIHKFSLIKADYLLEGDANAIPAFLFLGKRNEDEMLQMCRTFFKIGDKDYTEGQPRYTLLKKEKKNLLTGEVMVQYDTIGKKTGFRERS